RLYSTQRGLFGRRVAEVFSAIFKLCHRVQEDQVDFADGAVTLFGEDELRYATQIFAVALINFFAEDKANQIGVLLDGSGLAQIAELRTVVTHTGFRGTA